MMLYLRLFYEFFKTGLFSIGGGMATIPFLYKMSDNPELQWFTHQDLANMIAVGESTPGPIGVNMATYVGYITGMGQDGTVGAILGAIIATLGLVTPSIIVILIIASFLKNFRDNKYVNNAFYGLRPASTGLIASAGISVIVANLLLPNFSILNFQFNQINWVGVGLALVFWLLTNVIKPTKKWHPIIFIGISAVVGIVLKMG